MEYNHGYQCHILYCYTHICIRFQHIYRYRYIPCLYPHHKGVATTRHLKFTLLSILPLYALSSASQTPRSIPYSRLLRSVENTVVVLLQPLPQDMRTKTDTKQTDKKMMSLWRHSEIKKSVSANYKNAFTQVSTLSWFFM